jgi:hypothetical protein
MRNIVFAAVVALLLIAILPGCGKSEPTPQIPKPANADIIAEKLILAYDAKDYRAYLENFDEVATGTVGEDFFNGTADIILKKVGHYTPNSKVLTEVKPSGNYTEVIYKAQYSNDSDGVQVIVDLEISDNVTYAAGIWFNSPKLFK